RRLRAGEHNVYRYLCETPERQGLQGHEKFNLVVMQKQADEKACLDAYLNQTHPADGAEPIATLAQLIDGLRLEWEQKWVEWDEADTTLGTYTAADGYWCFEPMHSTKQVSGKCNSRTESRELCLADYKQRVRAIFEGQPQRKDG
ncbi:MAG: hypothetical protein EBR82_65480, partial [Caulobacteraceae bacterium]|nr:hypothetical protein [Caulobacteraceae bacterium]